jgi:predicted metalloprotease with PDZ domain
VPYGFDDLVRALNQVAAYDWAKLLNERVNSAEAHAPLGGIEHGGWRLVYNDKPNAYVSAAEKIGKRKNYFYSLGLAVGAEGKLADVVPRSPAYSAGLGPDMKIIAVNGRLWSNDILKEAIRASKENSKPIELLVSNAEFVKSYTIDYHGDLQIPHLERTNGDDLLDQILKPLTR